MFPASVIIDGGIVTITKSLTSIFLDNTVLKTKKFHANHVKYILKNR
jgi:hypothetical protein